jgi:hypothetical protein
MSQSNLEKSKLLKSQADQLMSELGIIEKLKTLGQLNFVGSYALDVMLKVDIDIHIIPEKMEPEKLMNFLFTLQTEHNLYAGGFINTVDYEDFRLQNLPADYKWPRGFYLSIRPVFEGIEWNFDIWYYNTKSDDNTLQITQELSVELQTRPELREIIIDLKNQSMNENQRSYLHNLNGLKIYQAVIYGGVSTIEELLDYYKNN